ncbi:hypothetical protein E4T56_gene1093 [Termitomyces sp. T112]|nr:hypothetical protein E4T56_gene1093 [Termitomyces sp. T112]KAH0579293.1 hypothetical protein H2248_003438 [Termitomyces sp. 'cryptogamus']KNZ76533.1 hypothetical protein J132_09955 [Termitomyces sp. J132]
MLKGKACINCRRRKIKCDGDRPSCGQCARSNGAFEDCEYPSSGPTQTEILEDRISYLQNRIRQLENKSKPTEARLQSPYNGASPPRVKTKTAPTLPSAHSSPLSQPSSSRGSRLKSASASPVQEPPVDIRLTLINIFYQYSSRFGFFLNVERFHPSFIEPQQIGHYSRPTPALLNAIYLWGTYLAPSPHDGCDEKAFLRNSLHHLSKDLSCSHPHKIIQGIQTEVLLSYYYLMNGKVLAGNYHANAAVSLCLSSGFHRIRTPIGPAIFSSTSRSSPPQPSSPLPKAVDDIEEGERVDAFWAVLILNNTWIAIQESHSMFYDLQTIGVDTPWPMDTFEYQLQLLPSVSSGTIKGFLDSTNIEGFSIMALHAKAAVLLEQATIYASNPEASDQRPSEISRLEAVIDQFQSQFPMVDRMDVTPSETDTLLMTQMMIHAATIKLHLPLLQKGETRSRQKTLAAAQAIAVLTHSIQPMSSIRVDPIVGVLWTVASEVFIRELFGPDSATMESRPQSQWSTLLHSILSQMTKFSEKNVLMKFLVKRIQKIHPGTLAYW